MGSGSSSNSGGAYSVPGHRNSILANASGRKFSAITFGSTNATAQPWLDLSEPHYEFLLHAYRLNHIFVELHEASDLCFGKGKKKKGLEVENICQQQQLLQAEGMNTIEKLLTSARFEKDGFNARVKKAFEKAEVGDANELLFDSDGASMKVEGMDVSYQRLTTFRVSDTSDQNNNDNDNVRSILDVVKTIVVLENTQQVLKFITAFKSDSEMKILSLKNSMQKEDRSATDVFDVYRSLVMHVDFNGHVCELQIHLDKFLGRKTELESHKKFFLAHYGSVKNDALLSKMSIFSMFSSAGNNKFPPDPSFQDFEQLLRANLVSKDVNNVEGLKDLCGKANMNAPALKVQAQQRLLELSEIKKNVRKASAKKAKMVATN